MILVAIYHYKTVFRTLIDRIVYLDLQISTDNEETFQHIWMEMFFCCFPLFEPGYGYLCYLGVCLFI